MKCSKLLINIKSSRNIANKRFESVLTQLRKLVRKLFRNNILKYTLKWLNKQEIGKFDLQSLAREMSEKFHEQESEFKIEETPRRKKAGSSYKSHKYSVVTYQMRVKLINLASSKGYSISRAARQLGIKPSTGKFIVKCFRDSGKIMKKTTNQQVISSSNCQDESQFSSRHLQGELKQKNCDSHQFLKAYFQEMGGQTMTPMAFQEPANQMFLINIPVQAPTLAPVIFYPNIQTFGSMMLPVYMA